MRELQLHRPGLALIAALALGACAQGSPADSRAVGATEEDASDTAAKLVRYECSDGSVVEASYPTVDTAKVSHDGEVTEMRIAVSGSGARYIGDGWEWWTKGMSEGTLTPLAAGEEITSAKGVHCTTE